MKKEFKGKQLCMMKILGHVKRMANCDSRLCCVVCLESCKHNPCFFSYRKNPYACLWKSTVAEILVASLSKEGWRQVFELHRVQYWLRKGHKESDDTFEGRAIRFLRKRYGKDFGEGEEYEKD